MPFSYGVQIRPRHGELFRRLMIGMERDKPILTDDTLEKHEVAENFVTVVNAPKQMLPETRASLSMAQWHIILRNDVGGRW